MINQAQSPWTPRLFGFIVPSLIGACVWWYTVSQVLNGRLEFSTAAISGMVVFIVFGFFSFGLWLGSISLIGYLTKGRLVRLVSALAVAWPILVFFPLTLLTAGVTLATALVLWWGIERFSHDADSRLLIKPQISLTWALPVILMLLIIGVSLLYYQQLRGSTRTADELANRLAGQSVSVIERFLPLVTKDYRPDMTVDELIGLQIPSAAELLRDIDFDQLDQSQLEQRLREALGSVEGFPADQFQIDPVTSQAELEAALDAQLADSRRQLSENIRQELSKRFQVSIEANQQVREVLIAVVNKQFDRYVSRYVSVIPWLLALALFFVLRIFSGFFLFSAAWIGWLILWIYRHLHVVHIAHETVPAEKVQWGR